MKTLVGCGGTPSVPVQAGLEFKASLFYLVSARLAIENLSRKKKKRKTHTHTAGLHYLQVIVKACLLFAGFFFSRPGQGPYRHAHTCQHTFFFLGGGTVSLYVA